MTDYQRGYDDGLERAAMMLMRKADKMRASGNTTGDTMARIFEAEADEILARRKTAQTSHRSAASPANN